MGVARIVIDGNCGRDPEERITKSGKKMASFSVAVSERVKEGDDWVDGATTWYRVTAFDWLAADVLAGVKKGQRVVVGGRFKLDEWEGNDGLRVTADITADWVGIKPRAPREEQQRTTTERQEQRERPKQTKRREYADADIPF